MKNSQRAFLCLVAILFSLSTLAAGRFGGGNEGGGNITNDGRVFDFAEYEDLEEIKDLKALDVFKDDLQDPNNVTANTWYHLKKLFEKEFNTAFLGFFFLKAKSKKWFFDNSNEPFAGACVNISLSDAKRVSVACQDDKEVRINKGWWMNPSTTNWQRLGIIMHELFLIHARSVYGTEGERKDNGEKAVRAINARMFAMLALDKTSLNYKADFENAKRAFVQELSNRWEMSNQMYLSSFSSNGSKMLSDFYENNGTGSIAVAASDSSGILEWFQIGTLLLNRNELSFAGSRNFSWVVSNSEKMNSCVQSQNPICFKQIYEDLQQKWLFDNFLTLRIETDFRFVFSRTKKGAVHPLFAEYCSERLGSNIDKPLNFEFDYKYLSSRSVYNEADFSIKMKILPEPEKDGLVGQVKEDRYTQVKCGSEKLQTDVSSGIFSEKLNKYYKENIQYAIDAHMKALEISYHYTAVQSHVP